MYLRDRADSEGKCWPGIKTIASDMRLSRSTVKRALIDLEQHISRADMYCELTLPARDISLPVSSVPVEKQNFLKP